jgi:hypothetical protein
LFVTCINKEKGWTMNFTRRDLQRGRREMEKKLTTAGKVRRQFAAGRPPKPGNWDTRAALRTITRRLDELVATLESEGLDRRDLSAEIVIGEFVPEPHDPLSTESIAAKIRIMTLVNKGESLLSAVVNVLMRHPEQVVIGTIFSIWDHEIVDPAKARQSWATPVFRDVDGAAEKALDAALERWRGRYAAKAPS